jgi:putative ABC transport system permease protein
MSSLTQIIAVSSMNIRSLPQRIGTSSVVVIGIAGVVAVLVSVLAMSTGLIKTMQKTGAQNRAIVVRTGSSAELVSVLTNDAVLTLADAAGIKKGTDGHPLASPEVVYIVNLKKKDGGEASGSVRGITQDGFAVRPEIKLLSGRMFKSGVTELVVGKSAARLYQGVAIGDQIKLNGTLWSIVGTFESGGTARESEMLADARTLSSAYRRGNSWQSVLVQLDSATSFQSFKDSITSNPQLQVDVSSEKDFGTRQSDTISRILSLVAYVVGGIMAVGAIFGALNTMYSAVSTRSREIATLRAIGFGPVPVVVSVFVEALLLSLIGGAVGAALAWLLFNGHSVDTNGGGFNGQLMFELTVTPGLIALGIIWACIIGMIGGLFPAIRAARLPVATALRSI